MREKKINIKKKKGTEKFTFLWDLSSKGNLKALYVSIMHENYAIE